MRRSGFAALGPGVLRPAVGALGFGALTACLFLAPTFLARSWHAGAAAALADGRDAAFRTVVAVKLLDLRASDGFDGLAKAVAADDAATWDSVRRLMEERRETDFWYTLRVEWAMDDGSREEMSYLRRPYEEPSHAREFLHILRIGRTGPLDGEVFSLEPDKTHTPANSILERAAATQR